MKKKVFVGLSGGVDSGVSAAVLRSQGHDVTGVFIKIWQPEFLECTWREDRLDAMRICAALEIPYREIDLSDAYKREVVENMIASYKAGRTPNPDVLCNRVIKFGEFSDWAFSEGADLVATGHYAQSLGGTLLRGKDTAKDQSYFLYRLKKRDLERILFPVGGMEKKDVRAAAERFGLPVAHKPDSQGLCFVGDVSLPEFLSRYITLERGDVLDTAGNVIGEHDGAPLYTLGQRHGFRVRQKSADEHSHFVVQIDTKANTITVSHDRHEAAVGMLRLEDISWVNEPVEGNFSAQTRYREEPVAVTIKNDSGSLQVSFDHPHIASPGQSLVLYRENEVVGGGVIA